jgi:ATP-binding cassette, subfamily B, bacterial
MFALIALGSAFLGPFASLVTSVPRIRRASAYLDRVLDVLEAPPEEATRRGRLRRPIRGRIDLDGVSFQYDRSAPLALRDVSLEVAPGEKLVVAGRTGSGKSTLVKLLLGLYAPTAGRISFDGVDLEEFELTALRAQFGSVLQEPVLFSGTIRDNIALHVPDASDSQIVEAARLAEIYDEIVQMPMGLDTWLREGGGGLSGGQRQRIALARALAARPSVLVLDEATSHLDAVTERRINENLRGRDCTQIVIAHRLSTIRDADLIVVLDEGLIAEAGSHAELVARNGHYASLVDGQLERGASVG